MEVDEAVWQVADRLNLDYGGMLGVDAIWLPTGETVRLNADEVFPTASVIKVAIVAELYSQAALGKIDLDERITVKAEDIVGGSGVLCNLTPGLALPLRDLAMLTISVSDNTGSNLCLRAVGGPPAVNASLTDLWGAKHTKIHRPIKFDLGPDDPPYTATGSPSDMSRLLLMLYHGQVGGKAVSDAVLALMAEVHDSDMAPRYLEVNPYASDLRNARASFTVAHKTGASTGIRNDAAVITRGDETLVICAYTKGVRDDRWTAENAGSTAVAEVSRIVSRHFFAR